MKGFSYMLWFLYPETPNLLKNMVIFKQAAIWVTVGLQSSWGGGIKQLPDKEVCSTLGVRTQHWTWCAGFHVVNASFCYHTLGPLCQMCIKELLANLEVFSSLGFFPVPQLKSFKYFRIITTDPKTDLQRKPAGIISCVKSSPLLPGCRITVL